MKERDLKNVLKNITASEEAKKRISEKTKNYGNREKHTKFQKGFLPVALAATMLLGITAFAATWQSNGFLQRFNISKNQMEKLKAYDEKLVTTPKASDTHNGITVSAAECLFDGNFVHMSFYVEGYELDKTVEPELENVDIYVNGMEACNLDYSFFNGIDWTDRKNPVMADGSPVKEDENGDYILNYRIADGKMELNLNWSGYIEGGKRLSEDELRNKKITVIMQNFGTIKGEWKLEWNLKNIEKGKNFAIDKQLGNTGARVVEVTLYSASAVIKYDFPKKDVEIDAYDENGRIYKTTDFTEPPYLKGVKLKDKTVYMEIGDGGSKGYENGNTDEFITRMSFSRIIDIDEITTLIFCEKPQENEKTGEILYEVEIPQAGD